MELGSCRSKNNICIHLLISFLFKYRNRRLNIYSWKFRFCNGIYMYRCRAIKHINIVMIVSSIVNVFYGVYFKTKKGDQYFGSDYCKIKSKLFCCMNVHYVCIIYYFIPHQTTYFGGEIVIAYNVQIYCIRSQGKFFAQKL